MIKDLLQTPGYGLKKRITILSTNEVITNIKEYEVSFKSDLWKTVCQSLTATFRGKYDLTDEDVKVEVGVWDDGTKQSEDIVWYDFGTFRVLRDGFDYNDALKETTIKNAYDKMVLTQLEWMQEDIGVEFPATIKQIVQAICDLTGIELKTQSWHRDDHTIEESKWHNNRLTYRNALDDIAQFCNATILIDDDKMMIKQVNTDVIDTIQKGKTSLDIKAYWGNVNILNLTREPQHDNYPYPEDWSDIPLSDRIELVFTNNQIIDKRREELAPSLFAGVEGMGYTPFEYTGFGYLTMKFGDYVEVKDKDNISHFGYITKGSWKVSTGFTEMLGCDLTNCAKEKYVLLSDKRREGIELYMILDLQNAKIEASVNRIDTLDGTVREQGSRITQTEAAIEDVVWSSKVYADGIEERMNSRVQTLEGFSETYEAKFTDLEGNVTTITNVFQYDSTVPEITLGGSDEQWDTHLKLRPNSVRMETKSGTQVSEFGSAGMFNTQWSNDTHIIKSFKEGSIRGTLFQDKGSGS